MRKIPNKKWKKKENLFFARLYSLAFAIQVCGHCKWQKYGSYCLHSLYERELYYVGHEEYFLVFLYSFILTKKCFISEVLMKILCLILLCIFSLDYFLCRFLSKKVSKLIYTKFKYMFYTVNTCSHFSEFNITVASYFLSGLEKYDSMLS